MGLLDSLFANQDDAVNPATFKMGQLAQEDVHVPYGDDYVGSVPIKRERKAKDVLDQDLKKFRETNPMTPAQAAAAAPPMLGSPSETPSPALAPPAPALAQGQPFTGPARTISALPAAGAPGGIDPRPPMAGTAPVGMLGPEMGGPMGAVPNATQPASMPMAGPIPLPQPRPAAPPEAAPTAGLGSPQPAATPQVSGSPAEGAIDMRDAPVGMLSKVWDGIKNNSNLLMGMGAGMMGAPSWATGFSRGFAGAQAGAGADYKQNYQAGSSQQLYTALVNAGVPRQQAIAATTNPELAKTLMASYIGDHKGELKEITLPDGRKMSVLHDPLATNPADRIKDLQGNRVDFSNTGGIDARLTGDDAYQAALQSNPKLAAKALALKEGREAWPVGRALTAGDNQQAMDLARQMDPGLTDATAKLRMQTVTDYGPKGKTGLARTAASTLMGHAEQYDKLIDRLGAWDTGGEYANIARDKFKSTLGTDKDYLKAKGEAAELRNGVANELEKALAGRVSVSGIQEILAPLKAAKGTTEQHAAIQGIIHMLGTRLDEMSNGFDSAMNTRTEGFHMLSPKAREIYKRYGGHVADTDVPGALPATPEPSNLAARAAALASSSAAPPPGNYVLDPKTRKLVPAP